MDKNEILIKIIDDLKTNSFDISFHAYQRMSERGITPIAIQYLINSPAINNYSWSENHQSWNFTGKDLSEDNITISCIYDEDGTLIVTVFWE